MMRMRIVFVLACCFVSLISGCRTTPAVAEQTVQAVDLFAVMEHAAQVQQPIVILIGEFGPSGADRGDDEPFDSPAIRSKANGVELLKMDLASSRNRGPVSHGTNAGACLPVL